jgi:hypothetical protein
MAEAAIIAAFMVIQFACMWAAVSYEKAKVQAMDEARSMAWQSALQACKGTESTLGDVANEAQEAGADALPDQSGAAVGSKVDLTKTSLATDSGYVDLTRERTVTFPQVIGGSQFTMKAHEYIRCNEPHPPENIKDFFEAAWHVITGH